MAPRSHEGLPNEDLMEAWNKRLAKEGMPAELGEENNLDESPAMKLIRNELRRHYSERGEADFGEHLKKMEEIKARASHMGATPEEVNALTEEFLKSIEDEIAQVQIAAVEAITAAILKDERILFRQKALEQEVVKALRKDFSGFEQSDLRALALHVVESELANRQIH